MGRIKTKKKLKFKYKIITFLIFLIASFIFFFEFFYNHIFKNIDNDKLINYLVNYNLKETEDKVYYDFLSLNASDFLLKYTLGIDKEKEEIEEENTVNTYDYVKDPYENTNTSKPIVYLYNTHQTEGYVSSNNESYNITPSVLMANYILRESLNDLGIPTMVETNNIKEILNANNWQYKYSYNASRLLVQDAMQKNSSLKYFIDLHRDSMNYDVTTLKINNDSYAKVLFVIGKEYDGYTKNLEFANKINEKIKNFNKDLSRGVTLKGGQNVNGVYNEDLSEHLILIELGGPYNNIVEVNNTLKVLSKAIYEVINEEG